MSEQPSDIIQLLPKDQWDEVMNQPYCDIEPVFMGFMDQYKILAQIIPKHFTVIDFGCAYNPQCFYFAEHKEYIAVDVSDCKKFKAPNCRIFNKSINGFMLTHAHEFYLKTTFAICQYVPADTKIIRDYFTNLFAYYPYDNFHFRPGTMGSP